MEQTGIWGEFIETLGYRRIRELGASYEIAYDDEPPVLTVSDVYSGRLRAVAYDKKSGLQSLKGFIDGRFVLFEYV